MTRSQAGWYLLAGVVALTPVGLRVATWRSQKHHAVDPAMAQAGQELFKHQWKPNDPLANGGDGLGPVYNANSCVACHHQGGVGGSGGVEHNVTTYAFTVAPPGRPREGVVHSHAVDPKYQETLALVSPELPNVTRPTLEQLVQLPRSGDHCIRFPINVHVSQRNTPALFGCQLIDDLPERVIIATERGQRLRWGMAPANGEDAPVGRAHRLADGRIGRFGWKAQAASLSDFVRAACANELGLGNPGQDQPRPLALLNRSGYQSMKLDLTEQQCDQLTAFCGSLPRPAERPGEGAAGKQAEAGKSLFNTIGCANCHVADLGSIKGVYSDLLLHRMGQDLQGGGSYNDPPPRRDPDRTPPSDGPDPREWRTPPLWGVADSAPYLHDGRANTLEEAIRMHGGQGAPAAQRFAALSTAEQGQVIAFLNTLRAP
jgi:CxxC motif-containing protein (DUF1111 family)